MSYERKQVPLMPPVVIDDFFAGFWIRLWAVFLDLIIIFPLLFIVYYVNMIGKYNYFYTFFTYQIFALWYYIFFVTKYGGTPGKLILGLKILKVDGGEIGYQEAILRYLLELILILLTFIVTAITLPKVDNNLFLSLSWIKQRHYLESLSPSLFSFNKWAYNLWTLSGVIVLISNKKKRTVHDFIAGTIVIKAKYVGMLKAENMDIVNLPEL